MIMDEIPYIAFSNEDLRSFSEDIGTMYCAKCKQHHEIRYIYPTGEAHDRSNALGIYDCDGKLYLHSVGGKVLG